MTAVPSRPAAADRSPGEARSSPPPMEFSAVPPPPSAMRRGPPGRPPPTRPSPPSPPLSVFGGFLRDLDWEDLLVLAVLTLLLKEDGADLAVIGIAAAVYLFLR